MVNHQDSAGRNVNGARVSITLKLVSIGILVFLLLLPAMMVQNLVSERQARRDSAVREISQKWGDPQTVTGPFITVPFKAFFKDDKGKTQHNIDYLHILPETLEIKGEITPEVRYRGIFEAVLYRISLRFSGNFKIPETGQLNIDPDNVLWDKASLSLGITDMRGIRDRIVLTFDGTAHDAQPGLKTTDLAAAGVSVPLRRLSPNETGRFAFDLDLNGSEQVSIIPVGESNAIEITSSWPSPSFSGAFLPVARTVGPDGFSARWKILHLNRNYPQSWTGARHDVGSSAFGLRLILTADIYQKSMRLAKYALIFLGFTFAAFFFSEVLDRRRIHPIQYILVGLAILIFYTLILSLSEHMHFNYAYLLSAAAVAGLISGYARAATSSSRFALTILGILGILYLYFFIILQLEDYALLLGSIGLLVVLAVVMYATRRINWYEIQVAAGDENRAGSRDKA